MPEVQTPRKEAPQPLPSPTTTANNAEAPAPAGHLSRYLVNWKSICSNNFVLRIIEEGYKFQFIASPIFHNPIVSNPKNPILREALVQEVSKHLKNGVISIVSPSDGHLVSRVFVVQKSSGGFRMVIDLKFLNSFIKI